MKGIIPFTPFIDFLYNYLGQDKKLWIGKLKLRNNYMNGVIKKQKISIEQVFPLCRKLGLKDEETMRIIMLYVVFNKN